MTSQWIIKNWALVAAGVIGCVVFAWVLKHRYENSARGRLAARTRELRIRKQEAKKAGRQLHRATDRVAGLRGKAATIKPRVIAEAEEVVQDASMLKKNCRRPGIGGAAARARRDS